MLVGVITHCVDKEVWRTFRLVLSSCSHTKHKQYWTIYWKKKRFSLNLSIRTCLPLWNHTRVKLSLHTLCLCCSDVTWSTSTSPGSVWVRYRACCDYSGILSSRILHRLMKSGSQTFPNQKGPSFHITIFDHDLSSFLHHSFQSPNHSYLSFVPTSDICSTIFLLFWKLFVLYPYIPYDIVD